MWQMSEVSCPVFTISGTELPTFRCNFLTALATIANFLSASVDSLLIIMTHVSQHQGYAMPVTMTYINWLGTLTCSDIVFKRITSPDAVATQTDSRSGKCWMPITTPLPSGERYPSDTRETELITWNYHISIKQMYIRNQQIYSRGYRALSTTPLFLFTSGGTIN